MLSSFIDCSNSGEHCQIKLDKDSGVFTIIDLSTNGTFVNGSQLKKDQPHNLQNGDKIYLLNDEAEGQKIGFAFVAVYDLPKKKSKKRSRDEIENNEESKETPSQANSKRLKRAETSAEVQRMKCSFCLEIMYKPVSLLPCLHNFCGGCYADWMKTKNDCPECRDKVKQIKRNHLISSMIDDYLKKNPDQEKSQAVKKAQDDKD